MSNTPILQLPLISESQASKFLTHNESIALIEAVIGASILDKDLSDPPTSPADGAAYLVAAGASGAWVGKSNYIAVRVNGSWQFIAPSTRIKPLFVLDEQADYYWNGSAWMPRSYSSGTDMLKATYDTNNNGIVDNSEALQGQAGSHYLSRTNHTGTQTATTISDFSEAVDDRVASLIQPGAGIGVTYNDVANTLTIANTGSGVSLNNTNTWTRAQSVQTFTVTYAASITIDCTQSNTFRITMTGNPTIAFSNFVDGQTINLELIHSGAARIVTWDSASTDFTAEGGTPTLSTASAKKDILTFVCTATKAQFVGIKRGFTA